MPATMAAMIGDRVFDEFPLSRVENQLRFGHERSGCLLEVSIWREKLAWLCDPAAFVAGKPTAVRGPSQEIGEWFILRNPPRIARHWSVLTVTDFGGLDVGIPQAMRRSIDFAANSHGIGAG